MSKEQDAIALNNLKSYIRIRSVQPNVDYTGCVDFLKTQANSLNLPVKLHHLEPTKPVVIITWTGLEPNLPTILLNSHMDVVPVFEDKWKHDPFAAVEIEGKIYGRGTQDMKSISIIYLEAIRRLKQAGVRLKRTVHLSFMPDEELGGRLGMGRFVNTPGFDELNVGVSFDEGLPSPRNEYILYNGERTLWCLFQNIHKSFLLKYYLIQHKIEPKIYVPHTHEKYLNLHFHCPGSKLSEFGHSSNTAGEKVSSLLRNIYNYREMQHQKLLNNPKLTIGDVLSMNLTRILDSEEKKSNKKEFILVVDCRVPVTVDEKKFAETLVDWCKEAGSDVWLEFEQKNPQVQPTKLDGTNPFWGALKHTTDSLGLVLNTSILAGGTDSRFIRHKGRAAFNFTPLNNTPILIHDHNEFIPIEGFLNAIELYVKIIPALANVPAQ